MFIAVLAAVSKGLKTADEKTCEECLQRLASLGVAEQNLTIDEIVELSSQAGEEDSHNLLARTLRLSLVCELTAFVNTARLCTLSDKHGMKGLVAHWCANIPG